MTPSKKRRLNMRVRSFASASGLSTTAWFQVFFVRIFRISENSSKYYEIPSHPDLPDFSRTFFCVVHQTHLRCGNQSVPARRGRAKSALRSLRDWPRRAYRRAGKGYPCPSASCPRTVTQGINTKQTTSQEEDGATRIHQTRWIDLLSQF